MGRPTRRFTRVVGVLAILAVTTPARADTARPRVPAQAAPAPPSPLPEVVPDPVLDEVPVVETREVRRADDALAAAQSAQDTAQVWWLLAEQARQGAAEQAAAATLTAAAAETAVGAATTELDRQQATLDRLQGVTDRERAALDRDQDQLRTVAAAAFASAPGDEFAAFGTWEQLSRGERRETARDRLIEVQSDVVEAQDGRWQDARDASDEQRRVRDEAQDELDDRIAERDRAVRDRDERDRLLRDADGQTADRLADLEAAAGRREDANEDRRRARLPARVEGVDLTLVDLDAYWKASGLAPCAVPWWVVAGVGLVETRHGTAQGSRVTAAGDTTVAILGIPLDGRPGVMAIPDSDGGRLDRDGTWDRAVGPMQFLPGTWGFFAVDADENGRADPHNLYDAAAAAGRLLCYTRGDLLTDGAQRAALLAYNRSVPYGNQVLAGGRRYRDALDLPDVPPEPEPEDGDGPPG